MKLKCSYENDLIKTDIENFTNACETCEINKYDRNPVKSEFISLTPASTVLML